MTLQLVVHVHLCGFSKFYLEINLWYVITEREQREISTHCKDCLQKYTHDTQRSGKKCINWNLPLPQVVNIKHLFSFLCFKSSCCNFSSLSTCPAFFSIKSERAWENGRIKIHLTRGRFRLFWQNVSPRRPLQEIGTTTLCHSVLF